MSDTSWFASGEGNLLTPCFFCLSCLRCCFIIPIFITCIVLATSLSGQDYVLQQGGCRIIRFDPEIRFGVAITEGGMAVGDLTDADAINGIYLIDTRFSIKPECEGFANGQWMSYVDYENERRARQACYAIDNQNHAMLYEWEDYANSDDCHLPTKSCDDMQILCDCDENTWAHVIPVGDLPPFCFEKTVVSPNITTLKTHQAGIFQDAVDTVSGFLFILPLTVWVILKTGHVFLDALIPDSEGDPFRICYALLNVVPHFLLRSAADIVLSEHVLGVAFFQVSALTHVFSWIGVMYIPVLGALIYFASPLFERERVSNEETVMLQCMIHSTKICSCCVFIPFVLFEGSLRFGTIYFGLAPESAFPWPELEISMTLSVLQVFRFLMTIIDIVMVSIKVLDTLCSPERH